MKINLFKGKSKRTQLFTLITIVGIVVVLALNLLLFRGFVGIGIGTGIEYE